MCVNIINKKRIIGVVILSVMLISIILTLNITKKNIDESLYKIEFEELVTQYSSEFDIDPYLVYAVIKTESGFEPDAISNVGARGLMQIMNDTFDWIKLKLQDDNSKSFDDMFIPAENIRYGCFLLSYLYKEFQVYETAIAAYHAGRTATAKWLTNQDYSDDGYSLNKIPIKDTNHYVNKVMKAFNIYKKIYEDGE